MCLSKHHVAPFPFPDCVSGKGCEVLTSCLKRIARFGFRTDYVSPLTTRFSPTYSENDPSISARHRGDVPRTLKLPVLLPRFTHRRRSP
jgi:hypothetical protein